MCEQTEISYLDGDVVWVKLGACWWPGQVTGFHNLPEDIQSEFKKKPLIAAVKFFQEDTYEFVKNYQQIYKYNCTLKDDFIKKGLDKYRTKSKDGSRYMDKFPGDVEMAEKLTGGDPDILNHDKFSPEEKPNISALFGEKKLPRKKRDREDTHRRSDGMEIVRKITHPRFLRESDHEVRIRQQPSSLPSTPNSTGSPQYPCHLCNFTSSRVNVIICHIKSHRSGNSSAARSKVKSYTQHGSRMSDTETPKRKYIRKEKSQSGKSKVNSETGKRKQAKQIEKASKKKKTDPKIRDTILADWEDESDEDMSLNQSKPLDVSSIIDTPTKSQSDFELVEESNRKHNTTGGDSNEIIEEAEKLLRETEKLSSIDIIEDTLTSDIRVAKSFKSSGSEKQSDSQKAGKALDSASTESIAKPRKEKEISNVENENKRTASDRDDKKSLLSCFDFHEEEPSIPPVRKKARAFHQKKEIIKEFEMSQALKTEQEKAADNGENKATEVCGNNANLKIDVRLLVNAEGSKETEINDDKLTDESVEPDSETKSMRKKIKEPAVVEESSEKRSGGNSEDQLEIVEIFEVEKEEVENRNIDNPPVSVEKRSEVNVTSDVTVSKDKSSLEEDELPLTGKSTDDKQPLSTDATVERSIAESIGHTPTKESDETLSERFTTETEDETVSESAETLPEQSENSDADMVDPEAASNSDIMRNVLSKQGAVEVTPKVVKKRRGRPRKSLESIRTSTSGSESPRMRDSKIMDNIFEKVEAERKTSESDGERSYSGRKRKPNKKYLEPDTYVQDAEQKASKTDESQSESDDRVPETVKGTLRKSKRPIRANKTKKTDNNERLEERELEKPLDAAMDTTISVSDIQLSKTELKDDFAESNVRKGESFSELDVKMTDNQPLEISEELEELKEAEFTSKDSAVLGLSSDDKLVVTEDTVNKPEKITTEEEKSEDGEMKSKTTLDRDNLNIDDLRDPSAGTAGTVRRDIMPNKEDSHQQSDITKTPVDLLPPKKSQIKKFELSQIDFFDMAPSSNKNIVESKSDKGEEKSEGTNKASTKVDSNRELIATLTQQEQLFPQSADIGKEVTCTTKDVVGEEEKLPQSEKNLPAYQEKADNVREADNKTCEKQEPRLKPESSEQLSKDATSALQDQQALKRTSMQTRYKGKFTPETGAKSKKEKEFFPEEKSTNTFQEAFLKTLHMDKKKGTTDDSETTIGKGKKGKKSVKRKLEELDTTSISLGITPDTKSDTLIEKLEISKNVSNIPDQESNSELAVPSNFQDVEAAIRVDPATGAKVDETALSLVQMGDKVGSTSAELDTPSKSLTRTSAIADSPKSFALNVQKLDESPKAPTSTCTSTSAAASTSTSTSAPVPVPVPATDVTVAVKKREMPRVIENVALKEPMQILKSKLLDKFPQKGVKHKLEADNVKKGEHRSSPKAKIMKVESVSPNSKIKTGQKVTSPRLSLTKKLQVLKAEEAETAAMMEAQSSELSKISMKTKSSTPASTPEKYIQQSSQSLADMELDINSMPFVLSEDVLTPENIEQMPVVISSILPASNAIPATLSFTPTSQMMSTSQTQYKLGNESTAEVSSPTKKKSGTPAILKNKNKAKPTITSIKTLVPPLTGGVKGLKFQSAAPANKTPPLLTQKGSPGKYVVVQTAGGQQLRYSVQGKSGAQPKVAIPTGKSAGNAQVVQQGGKVVILTSPQSGQTKMLPLNISKSLSGKVQRIMTSKGQVFCPISPQGIITSKTIIAPKTDGVSPTTSKLAPGHKIINTQGIITSKGVLTPIPGTIAKTALLGTLSQGILTKGGIYTPISASTLGGKTIISPKGLVTKGTTILSSQNLGTPKTILTPISQTIGGKTILSTQGIVSSKATVLTPITGQQVKAIAAKSPTKGSKVHYQSVQQKVQLPILQKSQKVQLPPAGQGKSAALKPSGNTVVLQNASPAQKTAQHGKKTTKQAGLQQGATLQNISSQSSAQQALGMVSHIQQKGKSAAAAGVQKVIIPRGNGSGRQSKSQQKIIVQKMHEPAVATVQNIQSKQSLCASPTTSVSNVSKMTAQQKQSLGSGTPTKATARGHATNKTAQQQKNLLNIAINSVTSTNVNTNISTTLSLPPLEPIESEKKSKIDHLGPDTVQNQKEQPRAEKSNMEKGIDGEKMEEPKMTAQPQIMALPTESSDGTQTYVLVTIDEQGQIQPLDNNALMSLEGTTQNPDGTRTIYIDPSSLGDAGTLDNIVLQFDNGALPGVQVPGAPESTPAIISESFPTSEVIQTSNQDILAAALANTDFQQEISLPDNPTVSVMTAGLTQTSLINQTILQSTIIPPTEPISSPSVLETSLTLNQPIMTPLEVPSNLAIQSDSTPTSVVKTIPSSLELPITITNPNISYIGTGEAQIQIPGNSMPDIGEIMESPNAVGIVQTQMPPSTRYLVLPNLEGNVTDVGTSHVESGAISIPSVSYSVSIPNNIVLENPQVQTTPSMPIIDDTYSEHAQFGASIEPSIQPSIDPSIQTSIAPSIQPSIESSMETSMESEQAFVDVPVSEMLVPKATSTSTERAQDAEITSEMIVSHTSVPAPSQGPIALAEETSIVNEEHVESGPLCEVYSSQQVPITSEELILQQALVQKNNDSDVVQVEGTEEVGNDEQTGQPTTSSMPIIDDTSLVTSESNVKIVPEEQVSFDVSDSDGIEASALQESTITDKVKQLTFVEQPPSSKVDSPIAEEQAAATSNEVEPDPETAHVLPAGSLDRVDEQTMDTEKTIESKMCATNTTKESDACQGDEPSSQGESELVERNLELHFEETNAAETSHEAPSQSYEQFGISMTTDSADLPSQSATKSENSREPSQSITYEPMETDEEAVITEPPTQSFEHSKPLNEASQSYEMSAEASTNAPTQSFNEVMQSQSQQEERATIDETIDDQTFPTQSYEVEKAENISENMETDPEISQEGNIPSQSNDIGNDGIGTSSVSTNNSGLNEDETASSSYVPETPENQERDQDQESAISTSSYEIPPCEELNIASSSVIPDTSVRAEHTSIHDNGVPEIPTSSYNLNPDITSTHVDSLPTSSYEDQVVVEQNVSTSYEIPISMPGLEETCSQNFVTESTDHRNEPSSYYAHHQEVTASYYESVDQETNSRLEEDPREEVTPSYYEGTPQEEASQSYFNPEEATPSYSSHNVSPSYYDPRPESEASQSYYSTEDMEKTEQSSSQNIEASQSFYQEQSDELKMRQRGEATPTYTERYPVDYTLDNSPMERHDLVESSVPASRPTER